MGGFQNVSSGFSASAPFPNPMGQGREARGRLRNLPSDFTQILISLNEELHERR